MWLPPSRAGKLAFCGRPCKREPRALGWHASRFTEDPRKVHVACDVCGKEMWLPRSRAGEYKRCSPSCNAAKRLERVEARRRECQTCGKSFVPRSVQVARGWGIFCSAGCNTARIAAISSQEAQRRAVAEMRRLRSLGLVKFYRGPEHPKWMGGPAAYRKRRIESGQARIDSRNYRKKNPLRVLEWGNNRTGRKIGRLPRGTVHRIGNAQRWKCAICQVGIRRKFHTDHIRPLFLGGRHEPRNIQLLCVSCNVRKNAKDPIDYMRSLGRLL